MIFPGISRKTVSCRLGVGEKQVGRYIKLAAKHLNLFADFVIPGTEILNGTPIETEEQIEGLKIVRSLLHKYKNTKNKEQAIALELQKVNQRIENNGNQQN